MHMHPKVYIQNECTMEFSFCT